MEMLEECVNKSIVDVKPDFVLYNAGVDTYSSDKLGRLKIAYTGICRRKQWVLKHWATVGLQVAASIVDG